MLHVKEIGFNGLQPVVCTLLIEGTQGHLSARITWYFCAHPKKSGNNSFTVFEGSF